MTQTYWEQRQEEILAFRDYVRGFDLARDVEAEAWLAESGHQLMETAFQLLFLGHEKDAVALAERAIDYYRASLASESSHPETDAPMSSVYQRLYYARWWVAGTEHKELLEQAAHAFCAGLTKSVTAENAAIYMRAALLWTEAGETTLAQPWINLVEEYTSAGGVSSSLAPPRVLQMLSVAAKRESPNSACSGLQEAIAQASAWEQPTAGTLWDALQLANIYRRLCDSPCDFPALLMRIR
jgi:hypothetical protein